MAESKSDVDDPYGFILELAYISPSQQQLLQNAPFVGSIPETPSFVAEDTPPEVNGSQGENPEKPQLQPQSGNTLEKKDVFDVLRVVSDFSNDDDVEDNMDNLSLLELLRSRGITFPRPRFWSDCHNCNWLFDDL